jgi:UPF0716 protein FxsA
VALLLVVAFVIVPLVEITVIVQVAHLVGGWATIGLLLLSSIIGAWLVRHEGFVVVRRFREQVADGKLPTDELIDGALLLVGGTLMLTPGFVTDAFGLALVFPITRIGIRTLVRRTVTRRVSVFGVIPGVVDARRRRGGPDDVIDL